MDDLERFARERQFDVDFLRDCGWSALAGGGIAITYHDDAGNELFTRRRDVPGCERFLNPEGVKMCPYGLNRLADMDSSTVLHITEGESDCVALWSIARCTIGIPGGSVFNCLQREHLGGADRLFICLDNDPPPKKGRRGCDVFRDGLLARLERIGFVGDAHVVRMPDGVKDVCELRLRDVATFSARWAALIASSEVVRFGAAAAESPVSESANESSPIVVRLADVTPQRVNFLWAGWLPEGALAVLDGDPGLGKSSLTLDLAARLSRGDALPPLEGRDTGRSPAATLFLNAEDSLTHTIRPRLDAMGGNCDLVYSLEGFHSSEGSERPVMLPADLERMEAFILEKNVKLVVIDPLMAYLGGEYDAHKDQDVRRCLRPMHRFAERLGVVILLVRHLNKLSGGPALYRGGSSIGITGASRASLIVGRDPNEDRFVLAMNKINVGPKPTSLAYRIEGAGMASRIVWEGEADLRPDQILGHTFSRPSGGTTNRGRPPSAIERAQQFLLSFLASGPRPTAEVNKVASDLGIAEATFKRARADVGVVPSKIDGVYMMSLPASGQAGTQNFDPPADFEGSEDANGDQEGTCDDNPFD